MPPFYLLRHGESEWNVLRLTQGQTAHPPLTPRGHEQARAAAAAVVADARARDVRVTTVVTSDLARAVETAEVIAVAVGARLVEDERLREQHLGDLEGRGYQETWAAGMEHDWSDPTARIAGGESVAELHARIAEVLDEVEPGTVLVSHGDAIRAALSYLDGHTPGTGPWVDVPNGAVFFVAPGVGWERLDDDGRGMADTAAG